MPATLQPLVAKKIIQTLQPRFPANSHSEPENRTRLNPEQQYWF
jgi:hypothetical protein